MRDTRRKFQGKLFCRRTKKNKKREHFDVTANRIGSRVRFENEHRSSSGSLELIIYEIIICAALETGALYRVI